MARIRLSRRLLLLMFAAMFPVVAVLFYNLYALHEAREREVRDRAFQTGQLAALEMQRILSGMENVLYTVSSAPSVQEYNVARCSRLLANAVARISGVQSVGVIGLDGLVKCRHDQKGVGISLADRQYFKDALSSDGFVVGVYTKSRVTGQALLPLAAPLKDPSGKTIGVVALSLDLGWLQKVVEARKFDPGSALTVADRDGVILARFPYPERFVGTRIPGQYRYLVNAGSPGTIELTSQDGTRRLLAYFPENAPGKGIYVSEGLSVENSFSSIRQAMIFSIIATVIAVFGSLLLAWQTNRFAIQKPVNHILGALNAWRDSKTEVRTGMRPGGDELGAIGAAIDGFMDELVVARQQRELLEAEMSHRIKNVLAVVQAVATQTFRGTTTMPDALAAYSNRLAAISDAFMVLRRDHETASLMDLVKTTIAPFEDMAQPRFRISGPPFDLSAKPALAIAMAVHELSTNAVKYGALSKPEGRVHVTWEISNGDLVFRWDEQDGPAVKPPDKAGFGSQMMEKALAAQTGGKVEVDYAATGLKYAFTAPVMALAATEEYENENSA